MNYEINGSGIVVVISGQITSKAYRSLYRDLLIREGLKKKSNLKKTFHVSGLNSTVWSLQPYNMYFSV